MVHLNLYLYSNQEPANRLRSGQMRSPDARNSPSGSGIQSRVEAQIRAELPSRTELSRPKPDSKVVVRIHAEGSTPDSMGTDV